MTTEHLVPISFHILFNTTITPMNIQYHHNHHLNLCLNLPLPFLRLFIQPNLTRFTKPLKLPAPNTNHFSVYNPSIFHRDFIRGCVSASSSFLTDKEIAFHSTQRFNAAF